MVWKPEYIVLIVLSSYTNFYFGKKIHISNSVYVRKRYLYLSVCFNLGLLFVFKYCNLFIATLFAPITFLSSGIDAPVLDILLPMGISFYTFQAMSYVIDIYRGSLKPESNFWFFSLYVTFFPQLVAGPIERSGRLLPQLKKHHRFDVERILCGIKRIFWGLFKKVIVADRLAVMVNLVYESPSSYDGFQFLVATLFFTFQIYYDFSAYSDIAIGSAQVLGIKLMENFRTPYLSMSITEFWRRWHISLSTWFKDYLYIPLGGSRCKSNRVHLNLMITFLVSGLWHGANWTFVFWGGLHGLLLMFEKGMSKFIQNLKITWNIKNSSVTRCARLLATFLIVNISWIFFRSNNLQDSFYIISKILIIFDRNYDLAYFVSSIRELAISMFDFFIATLGIVFIGGAEVLSINGYWAYIYKKYMGIRWLVYYIVILMLLFCIPSTSTSEFIYFQF